MEISADDRGVDIQVYPCNDRELEVFTMEKHIKENLKTYFVSVSKDALAYAEPLVGHENAKVLVARRPLEVLETYAEEKYNWDKIVSETREVFGKLLNPMEVKELAQETIPVPVLRIVESYLDAPIGSTSLRKSLWSLRGISF